MQPHLSGPHRAKVTSHGGSWKLSDVVLAEGTPSPSATPS